ncbi:hypothetical protein E4U43_002347 [Claviceps pusilla]|uniref:Uncharacterized protein n=1 Tax=Claviceps pusilla TaxID=123648 RepID=A0A9P7SYK7_9HYPO|nr:hypothetical protein E4U43_002347 [Claviceps pusilla]
MNPPEKRRASSGHVLRTGPGHATRQNQAMSRQSVGSNDNYSTRGNYMPSLPVRAALANNSGSNNSYSSSINITARPEDAHDHDSNNAASRAEKDQETTLPPRRTGHATQSTRERDKDERIALLENEMALMREDFSQQLHELRQNETETATFWQAKHSALNQQFLRTDTELRVLKAEAHDREAERRELRQGWDTLRREVKEREDEISLLRKQVRDMKKFLSTSTRTDGQTTDEVFGEGMARLGNGLQNWVITHFRRARFVDFDKIDTTTLAELADLVPMYEDLLARGAKVHMLQSVVSRILVEMVFGIYFLGLSDEQMQHFRRMERTLCQLGLSEESVNQWRASTLAVLHRDAPQLLQDKTDTHIEKVTLRINQILDTVTADGDRSTPSTSASSRSDTRDSSLRMLVTNSVELARLLVAQKAVLRVHMPEVVPHQQVVFDPDTMEDMGGEDEDALAGREIWCVVFPGVIKYGDETGGQMQFRNVIAKAKVLCRPED